LGESNIEDIDRDITAKRSGEVLPCFAPLAGLRSFLLSGRTCFFYPVEITTSGAVLAISDESEPFRRRAEPQAAH
jgi:hypothetical protein